MNTNHLVRSFALCMLSFCLSGWSLVTPATAATIVVTTNQDVIDSPFTTANFCGTGTVANLPGADRKVSLREAIIAANNTPGQQTITFAPSLNGSTITLTNALGSLFLCGGQTTINGDINGDGNPDVTVDGTAAVTFFDVINLVSSHNTIKNLHVLVPPPTFFIPAGISVSNLLTPNVTDNTIVHNTVGGPIAVVPGLDATKHAQHAVSIKHTLVRDNTSSGIGIVIYGTHNTVTDLTFAHNTVSGVALSPPFNGPAILVIGGFKNPFDPNDPGASDNQLDVTITDNTVTDNSNPGDTAGIGILGGYVSSSRNHVSAEVRNNTITDNNGRAIAALAGVSGGSDNQLDVTTEGNIIKRNSLPGDTVGIGIDGGVVSSSGNHVEATVRNNTITDNTGNGIVLVAGIIDSSHNDIDGVIRDNTLENNGGVGIGTLSGVGASGDSSGNSLDARIENNTVKNAFLSGIYVSGGTGSINEPAGTANNNDLDVVVVNNTVTGSVDDGIRLVAGDIGLANSNEVEIQVRKNTVCGSTGGVDISAIGGAPPNQGTGNKVAGEISKNTVTNPATTVVVNNGVAGNLAQVTQSKNVACQ